LQTLFPPTSQNALKIGPRPAIRVSRPYLDGSQRRIRALFSTYIFRQPNPAAGRWHPFMTSKLEESTMGSALGSAFFLAASDAQINLNWPAAIVALLAGAAISWWLRGRKIASFAQSSMRESEPVDFRTDPLTGLPNRTAFCEDVRRRLCELQRHGNRLSMAMVRLDNLDELLARYGAPTRDHVLRSASRFLNFSVREMDVVARFSDEAFVILLPGTALMQAAGAGARLRAAIENCQMNVTAVPLHLTASFGVSEAHPGEELGNFLARAEAAQRASTVAGGNAVHFHTGTSIAVFSRLPQGPKTAQGSEDDLDLSCETAAR
jgi:diguanylate cyclase (GGDEF)-like protein